MMLKKLFFGARIVLATTLIGGLTAAPVMAAGDAVAGKARSTVCASCHGQNGICLLYTSPSPRDRTRSRMPSSA